MSLKPAGGTRKEAALKRGADELMDRAEYALRQYPRALARVRRDAVRIRLSAVRKMIEAGIIAARELRQ